MMTPAFSCDEGLINVESIVTGAGGDDGTRIVADVYFYQRLGLGFDHGLVEAY